MPSGHLWLVAAVLPSKVAFPSQKHIEQPRTWGGCMSTLVDSQEKFALQKGQPARVFCTNRDPLTCKAKAFYWKGLENGCGAGWGRGEGAWRPVLRSRQKPWQLMLGRQVDVSAKYCRSVEHTGFIYELDTRGGIQGRGDKRLQVLCPVWLAAGELCSEPGEAGICLGQGHV